MTRTRASAKAAGSKFERDIADHLADLEHRGIKTQATLNEGGFTHAQEAL